MSERDRLKRMLKAAEEANKTAKKLGDNIRSLTMDYNSLVTNINFVRSKALGIIKALENDPAVTIDMNADLKKLRELMEAM